MISIIGILLGLVMLSLLPIGLGIIASKRGYSVPWFVAIGVLLGPLYAIAATIINKPYMGIPIIFFCAMGILTFIISLCLHKKPEKEPQVTLHMPLPPGHGE